MSSNAASLRRVLRSIGNHATPTFAVSSAWKPNGSAFAHKESLYSGKGGGIATHTRGDPIGTRGFRSRPSRKASAQSQEAPRRNANDDDFYHDRVPRSAVPSGEIRDGRAQSLDTGGREASSAADSAKGEATTNASAARDSTQESTEATFQIRRLQSTITERQSRIDDSPDDRSGDSADFEAAIRGAEVRSRDGLGTRLKEKDELPKRYYDKASKKTRIAVKSQARRREIEIARRGRVKQERWRDILRMLEGGAPSELSAYVKRMETVRLPEGLLLAFTRDPGESVLHVMQQTGSHIQAASHSADKHFPALTLYGTPSQNAHAKQLLQETDILQAVSQDDLNASKSMTDYNLQIQVSDRYGGAIAADGGNPLDDLDEQWNEDEENRKPRPTASPSTETEYRTPTRAVWSTIRTGHGIVGVETNPSRPSGLELIVGANSLPASAVSFVARIRDLVKPVPRLVLKKYLQHHKKRIHLQDLVRDELVLLFTDKNNASLITLEAVELATQFLSRHMFFPPARQVLTSLEESKVTLTTGVFDGLLAAAARAEDVYNFQYLVRMMRRRELKPSAMTWKHFQTLMLTRFPGETDGIIKRLQAKMQASPPARIASVEDTAADLLRAYQDMSPDASILDFLTEIDQQTSGFTYFTAFYANRLINVLLSQGKTNEAFIVFDELARRGRRQPDIVTLNTFLSAAHKARDLGMAVMILKKFHYSRVRKAPTPGRGHGALEPQQSADAAGAVAVTEQGRTQNQDQTKDAHENTRNPSVVLNENSFRMLLYLAWNTGSWNSFRVFWRYGCCAGHVPTLIQQKMKRSIRSKASLTMSAKDIEVVRPDEQEESDKALNDGASALSPEREILPTDGQLRNVWMARFAVGVADGSSHSRNVFPDATGNGPHGPGAPDPAGMRGLIEQDLGEVQSSRPLVSLADMAERALLLDKDWKRRRLGRPAGLSEDRFGDRMLEMMLSEGIRVPMKIGDAVGMRV